MPLNLGNTMFARWYGQKMNDLAQRQAAVNADRADPRLDAELSAGYDKMGAERD